MSLLGDAWGAVDRFWMGYVVLGTLVLLVAGTWVCWRLANRHRDVDRRARVKVAVALVIALVIGGGGYAMLNQFEQAGVAGIHKTLTSNLNLTVGEGDYLDAARSIRTKTDLDPANGTLLKIQANLTATQAQIAAAARDIPAVAANVTALTANIAALAQAHHDALALFANGAPGSDNIDKTALNKLADELNATNNGLRDTATAAGAPQSFVNLTLIVSDKVVALRATYTDLYTAQVTMRKLAPNHALWLDVQRLLAQGQDEEAHARLDASQSAATVGQVVDEASACDRAESGFCKNPRVTVALTHDFRQIIGAHIEQLTMKDGIEEDFARQADGLAQMHSELKWFGYPAITGLFLAPFAFVGGHILGRAFVPSDTVGFKRYPGKAAGFFLLCGGFGVFAIPFSAWVLVDMHKRGNEGQIAL